MRNAILINPKVIKVEKLKAVGTTVVTLKGIDEVVELNTGEGVAEMFERLTEEAIGTVPARHTIEIADGAIKHLINEVNKWKAEHRLMDEIVEEVVYTLTGILTELK